MWLLYIVMFLVAGFVALAMLGFALSKKSSRQLAQRFRRLDEEYKDYVERYVSLEVLENQSLDLKLEEMVRKAMVVMRPSLEGILMSVRGIDQTDIDVGEATRYFPNLAARAETICNKKMQMDDAMMKEIEADFEEAIRADLMKRAMSLRSDNYLGS